MRVGGNDQDGDGVKPHVAGSLGLSGKGRRRRRQRKEFPHSLRTLQASTAAAGGDECSIPHLNTCLSEV